jgi:hypothetical protein
LIINATSIKSAVSTLFKVALTFGLIFDLDFSAAPSLTTGRLVLLVMIFLYGKDAFTLIVQFARQYTFSFSLFMSLLPFTMFWLVINGTEDTVMFSRAFWFILFSVLSAFLYVRMCRFNLSSAMSYYFIAMLIQALLVFNSVLDPDFRTWVNHALINRGNIDFSEEVRFAGLSNSGGAQVSLQLGLGVVASLVLFIRSPSVLGRFGLVLAALLITIATIFVGRTGLYLSLLTMLGFIFLSRRALFIPVLLITSTLALSSYIFSASLDEVGLKINDVKLERTVQWAFDLFLTGKSSSAEALVSGFSETRELSVTELMIGSGRVKVREGVNYSGNDSGYIQSLYALGLPLSILFYAALFWVYWQMLRPVRGRLKTIGLALVALVFILEMKEPFIFKYTLPFFVLVYVYLAQLNFVKKN